MPTRSPIAQIAPSEAPLAIKALVSSVDISKVATGQTVQMRVSACPYPDFGTLPGTFAAISPDAIAPETQDQNAAAGNFQVTIALESLKLTAPGREYKIKSGMEGRADIISREETVLTFNRLLKSGAMSNYYSMSPKAIKVKAQSIGNSGVVVKQINFFRSIWAIAIDRSTVFHARPKIVQTTPGSLANACSNLTS
ncbi:MAG: hypothetical protein AB4352_25610 [Hormoscilla sp.]